MSQLESNKEFDKTAHFYNFLYDLCPEEREKYKLWTEDQLNTIRKLLKDNGAILEKSVIVDLGGGTGRLSYPLSLDCEKLILAEPSEKMLLVAKRKLNQQKHGKIEFLQQGFLDISLPDSSIDIVISINDPFQFLLEKDEQIQALENMRRILKPGGILILENMNFFSLIFGIKTPKPRYWETEDYKGSNFIQHKMHKLKGIWYHIENIYIEDKKTGNIEHIEAEYKLKNISSTELELLHDIVGFEEFKIYPGHNLEAEDGNRFLTIAKIQVKIS